MKKTIVALAAALALAVTAPASAVVGGQDAAPGEFPSVAEISFGIFACTGTLIAPNWVLSAGHCGSVTGGAEVASPASWPAPMISVVVGSHKAGDGQRMAVRRVLLNPNYLLTDGYDISLLELTAPSSKAPTKIAGSTERASWNAGVLATIAGWGDTTGEQDFPDTLQKAQVPITTDAYCANAYSSFDVRTMVCAGYPQGGVDTCQGDSGGPLFVNAAGGRRVAGATSFGRGCAQPGYPGVYARVADSVLSTWIKSHTGLGAFGA